MPLLSDSAVFGSDEASPSPYGLPPGLESEDRRETPECARKTWKAYHERQARLAEQRQLSRPVAVDHILWGDLLSGKLVELIEGERNHPRTILSDGAADRDGGHCLLPELDGARFHSGHDRALAAAVGKPKVLRFSGEGSEYTADNFGAAGDFNEMYKRRYTGFDGLVKEAKGLAAERAWSRAGRPGDSEVGESHRERRSRERMSREAQSIPWDLGTTQASSTATPATPSGGGRTGGSAKSGCSRSREGGVRGSRGSGDDRGLAGSFGDDLFAGDAASALAAGRDDGEQQLDSDLQTHLNPHIGPDTHCLIAEEVEHVHRMHNEERADGSNASLATQMQHRLVPLGGGAGGTRKLRGTAARERHEQARIVMKDRYVEEAVRRNRAQFTCDDDDSGGGGYDDDDSHNKANSTACSVTTFETYYIRATTAADALPTAERGFSEENPDAEQPHTAPTKAQVVPVVKPAAVVPPTPTALEKEERRAERKAERAAKVEAWRGGTKRLEATLDSSGGEAPTKTLPLRRIDDGGCGSGFVDANDEISIAPSMSSLGSFDEQSAGVSHSVLQQAREADEADVLLPPVLHRPRDVDPTAGKNRQSFRRRVGRTIPLAPPSGGAPDGGNEGGSTATIKGAICAEGERSSSRSGIAFGGSGKRRQSRGPSSSGSSAVAVGLADSLVVAVVDPDGKDELVTSAAGPPLKVAIGIASAAASSTTAAVATASLLKRKINWWRGLSKPPPVPPRSSASMMPTGEDGLLRGTTSSSAPLYPRRQSGCGNSSPFLDSSASREPQPQLPVTMGGVTDDDKTLAGSVISSLTSLGASMRGPMSARPLADTESSVASSASISAASGSEELAGGHSVAGSAATARTMTTQGAGDGGAGPGTRRTPLDLGEHNKSRKKRRDRGGAQRVHKISLGSKRHQKAMKPAERTALLIGACEWGDIEALERLLELGASPLDSYSPSIEGSRCVFCEFFLFVLQVEAGLRPQLAPDDSLHTRALSTLIEASLKKNPLFLSTPKLRDQDDRGFCLLHHAAAFGNANKVEFLLERGVDPDVRSRGNDETSLLIAARRGKRLHLRVAAALIRSGANMLARDRKGMTPLHQAADVGRKHMCHYLLLIGADKLAQDNKGRTPLDLCHGKHPRVSAVLRSFAGCKPPPASILSYMEKVEVLGLGDSTAQEFMLQEQAERKEAQASEAAASAASAADAVGAADMIFGDDDSSLASWDAASLGGMSGDGTSVLSLGNPATAA